MNAAPPPLPAAEPTARPRRRRWIYPLGVALGLSAVFVFYASTTFLRFASWRELEPYRDALRRVRADPTTSAALGAPIEEGWYIRGSVQSLETGGLADFSVPVSGPKGDARVKIVAWFQDGVWRYERIAVDFEDDRADRDLTPKLFEDDLGAFGEETGR